MAEKSLRLSQLAKECNTGVSTVMDFLQEKGITEKMRPTTKISEDYIQLALEKFAPDKARKEASEKVSLQKKEEKEALRAEKDEVQDIAVEETPVQASSVIKGRASSLTGPKTVGKIDLDKKPVESEPKEEKEVVAATPEPAAVEETPAPVVVESIVEAKEEEKPAEPIAKEKEPIAEVEVPKVEAPKVEESKPEPVAVKETVVEEKPAPTPVAEEPKLEAAPPVKEEVKAEVKKAPEAQVKAEVKAPEVQVAVEVKEEAPVVAEKEVAQVKEDVKVVEGVIPVVENTTEKATETPVEGADEAKPADDGKITTKFQKLSGPKFTGEKVDLSKFERPKKKKVASSTDNKGGLNKKRQRKRIVKPGETAAGANKPGGAAGARPGARPGGPGANRPGARPGGPGGRGRGPRKVEPKRELTPEEIQKQIKETLEKLTGGGKKSKGSKFRREKRQERKERVALDEQRQEEESKIVKVTEFVTVSELANMMDVSVNEIISACMSLGMMVTMNQRLDGETLNIVAEEFGFAVEFVGTDVTDAVEVIEDAEEDLQHRAPIVTVMGHVDHGKTSLLDYVRKANVIAGESGGITQHIGAYSVELESGQHMTFLDTPGHEAFTAMRARGAKVTDIAIIVVAADDDVMPQTKEAISHAQAAQVPIVFAINKVDREAANPEKIKESLAQMNLLVEDWGGKVQSHDISAKTGLGVPELLEKVLLEAELLELKANPDRNANGTIVEASLDKGRGYVTTILIQNGTLKIGDYVLAGQYSGKVRAMLDERGHRVEEAGPAQPVSILGLDGAPQAGDTFIVMDDEKDAKNIASKRTQLQREQSARSQKNLTLEEIGRRLAIGDFKELNIIVKGDVDGSIEALSDSLQKLSTEEIQVNIIHKAVGQISESDILLAAASDAIIVGFQVRPSGNARKLAEKENVDIRLYSIIYAAIDEIKDAMEGMLSPEVKEEIVCNIEIRETFKISKVGTIAGCYVMDGTVKRNTKIRLIRNGVVVYTGELGSLKRFKDDVKEVNKGYECGLNVQNFNDIKVGDIIEGFEQVEVKKTLK